MGSEIIFPEVDDEIYSKSSGESNLYQKFNFEIYHEGEEDQYESIVKEEVPITKNDESN